MPTTVPMPLPRLQFFDSNGDPLAGGKVYFYAAGTSTPQATYADQGGTIQNTNPVILDSAGQATIWFGPLAYDILLQDANGSQQWTVDDVSGWVDLFSNQTIAGTKTFTGGVVFNGTLTATGAATFTSLTVLSGVISAGHINRSFIVDGVTYPQTDTGLHSAVADAVTQGGGTVIIPDFVSISLTTALILGVDNATKPCIRLEIGVGSAIHIAINNPGSDAISVGDGCAIVGKGGPTNFLGSNDPSSIVVDAAARVANVIAPLSKTGSQNGMTLEKFILTSTSGADITSAGILVQGVFQNSWFRDIYTNNGFSASPFAMLLVLPGLGPTGFVTSDIIFDNCNFDGTGKANCTPVSIQGVAASAISGITFLKGGIQHAGAGLPLLNINGNAVSGGIATLNFYGVHFETVAGGGASSILVADARGVIFDGCNLSGTAFTNAFLISQSGAGLTRNIQIRNFYMAPVYTNFVNNSIDSFTRAGNLITYGLYGYDVSNAYDFDVPVAITGATTVNNTLKAKRYFASLGTALVTGDFVLSGGWGAGAAVSAVTGTDQAWQATVTSAGAGQAANPTVTLTFKDLTWGASAPICDTKIQSTTDAAAKLLTAITDAPTQTTNVITYNDTPVVNKAYTFTSITIGR